MNDWLKRCVITKQSWPILNIFQNAIG